MSSMRMMLNQAKIHVPFQRAEMQRIKNKFDGERTGSKTRYGARSTLILEPRIGVRRTSFEDN